MLFYRVWASGRPTVSHDRPATDRFQRLHRRARRAWAWRRCVSATTFPDAAKLFFAGRLAAQTRNAEGLRSDHRRLLRHAGPHRGVRRRLAGAAAWRTAGGCPDGRAVTAGRVDDPWRARLGTPGQVPGRPGTARPQANFDRCCRADPTCRKLTAVVRNYIGDELRWDARLILKDRVEEPLDTGRARLWLDDLARSLPATAGLEDLVLDPQQETHQAAL